MYEKRENLDTTKMVSEGIDISTIALDSAGRFILTDDQLALVSGGMASKDCIIIIRGTKCRKECA